MLLFNFKSRLFILISCLVCSLSRAQNETDLLYISFGGIQNVNLYSESLPVLNEIEQDIEHFKFGFSYGQEIPRLKLDLFCEAEYNHLKFEQNLPQVGMTSSFLEIPQYYYQTPDFSQLNLSVGLVKPLKAKWSIYGGFSSSLTNNYTASKVLPNYAWSGTSYLERSPNDNFSFGLGLFFNQLESRLIFSPMFSLRYQKLKKGIEIVFPEKIVVWHKIRSSGYLSLALTTNSYSIKHLPKDDLNVSNDFYALNVELNYHFIWQDMIKFSIGSYLPTWFATINSPDTNFNYSLNNGLGFKIALSLITND